MPFLTGIFNGYVTFVVSIAFIGGCTAIIGDVAGHLGCFINLKDGVNAIAFVALGTSVPGTTMSTEFPMSIQNKYIFYILYMLFHISLNDLRYLLLYFFCLFTLSMLIINF